MKNIKVKKNMGKEIDKNSLRWRMFKRFRLGSVLFSLISFSIRSYHCKERALLHDNQKWTSRIFLHSYRQVISIHDLNFIDYRYTQNPDTVTAAFTSLLVITGELAVPGWRIGKEILLGILAELKSYSDSIAAIVGSIWGSIFNFMFIATELNPNLGSWLSLVRVPLVT